MKFMAPSIEEIPARCKLKIARSIDPPEWELIPAKGGYTVQPVPAPCSTKLLASNNPNAGGSNQKLILFRRGNRLP